MSASPDAPRSALDPGFGFTWVQWVTLGVVVSVALAAFGSGFRVISQYGSVLAVFDVVVWFFEAAWCKRAALVPSTVPLTIVANSLRIGLIGVTVEHWGPQMAEGLLHDFEGWFALMICLVLLAVEISLLARLGGATLASGFVLHLPAPHAKATPGMQRRAPAEPLLAAWALFAATALLLTWTPQRQSTRPQRQVRDRFPLELAGGWTGRSQPLDREIVATLAVDDYVAADYRHAGEPAVNFYVAYYAAQGGGQSTHSPRTWFILRDGLLLGRSDGALLRLVTAVTPGESMVAAEVRLQSLMSAVQQELPLYVPD